MTLQSKTAPLALLVTLLAGCAHDPPAASPPPPPIDPAPAPPRVDPTESAGPIALPPLFTKDKPPAFQAATTNDMACLGQASSSGDRAKDFASLEAACGAPTGLVRYTKPFTGRLHYERDRRDEYSVPLLGGYCYRVFAVGDPSMIDLDLDLQTPDHKPLARDATVGPAATLSSDSGTCVARDGDYILGAQVDGLGFGSYTFAIWAKPAPTRAGG